VSKLSTSFAGDGIVQLKTDLVGSGYRHDRLVRIT